MPKEPKFNPPKKQHELFGLPFDSYGTIEIDWVNRSFDFNTYADYKDVPRKFKRKG